MRRPGETGCERRGENDASSDDSPSEKEIGLLVVDDDCEAAVAFIGPSAGGCLEPRQGSDR